MEFKKPTAFIDEWVLNENDHGEKWLTGKISGHEKQHQFIASIQSTSAIIREDYENDEVETMNTVYKLGKRYFSLSNEHYQGRWS